MINRPIFGWFASLVCLPLPARDELERGTSSVLIEVWREETSQTSMPTKLDHGSRGKPKRKTDCSGYAVKKEGSEDG